MNPTLLAVLVAAMGGIIAIRRWFSESRQTTRKLKATALSDFLPVYNEYYRYSRGGRTDPDEHSRIISHAQSILLNVVEQCGKNCPQEYLDVHTETDANLQTFKRIDEKATKQLEYIARKRLTPNQVTKGVNWLECDQWGEYPERNEQALDDAMHILEKL